MNRGFKERRSRSIRYRLGVAGLPVMKDLESFRFEQSPVNAALVRSLHDGERRIWRIECCNSGNGGGDFDGRLFVAPTGIFVTGAVVSIF